MFRFSFGLFLFRALGSQRPLMRAGSISSCFKWLHVKDTILIRRVERVSKCEMGLAYMREVLLAGPTTRILAQFLIALWVRYKYAIKRFTRNPRLFGQQRLLRTCTRQLKRAGVQRLFRLYKKSGIKSGLSGKTQAASYLSEQHVAIKVWSLV
jgi:hypothetical protein